MSPPPPPPGTSGKQTLASPSGSERGFTLLEVMIAVAIAALAMLVLFRTGSSGVLAAHTAGRVEEAVERAQSHIAALGWDVSLLPSQLEGDDGDGFRWRIDVRPLLTRVSRSTSGTPTVGSTLYEIEGIVSWRERGRERSVALKTLRIGAASSGE